MIRLHRILLLIILLLPIFLLMPGCGEKPADARLLSLYDDGRMDSAPLEIVSALDSIDISTLSVADRKFYELLRLKAEDKAYVEHKSDTVILSLVEYYKEHPYRDLYPEALYYAGRVYSDMGDYPTSLRYFQSALDALPGNTSNLQLKGVILSQTGRLLSNLRLYDEAVPYIQGSIEEGWRRNDTLNVVYDLQLLGDLYLQDSQFDKSETCLLSSLMICPPRYSKVRAKTQMYLADLKNKKGKIDSARLLIHGVPDKVSPLARNNALNTATEIYLDVHMPDSAYYYCTQLLRSEMPLNKHMAYHYLLSPELISLTPADTIVNYVLNYRNLLEEFYDDNRNQLALNQEALYNYQLHERERVKAERNNRRLMFILWGILMLLLSSAVVILYLKNRNKSNIIRLQQAIDTINQLTCEIDRIKSFEESSQTHPASVDVSDRREESNDIVTSKPESSDMVPSRKMEADLRDRLINDLKALYARTEGNVAISPIILQSAVYAELQKKVENEQLIDDEFSWEELERVIDMASPEFRKRLTLLTRGKLNALHLHTAMLIKCGVSPIQMAVLFGRSKGAIVSRRESLSLKLFDEKLGTKVTDAIIRLL